MNREPVGGGGERTLKEQQQSSGKGGDTQTAGWPTDQPWQKDSDRWFSFFIYLYVTEPMQEQLQRSAKFS